MRIATFFTICCLFLLSCGSDTQKETETPQAVEQPAAPTVQSTDPNLQEKVENLKPKPPNMPDEPVELKGVNLTTPLLGYMVRKGEKVYNEKCASCHSLDGSNSTAVTFASITKNRRPEWIMNLTTGVDMKFADARREQNRLNKCYTRQPGQRLNIEQSRDILEFLRHNDGEE